MNESDLVYEYKLAALSAPIKLCLTENQLRVFKETNRGFEQSKVLSLEHIDLMRQFREVHATDSAMGGFNMQRIVVFGRDQDRVDITSAYITGNKGRFLMEGRNQEPDFLAFIQLLKERICKYNPTAKFQSGWLAASLAWALVALLGVGLLILGVAFVLFEKDWVSALLPTVFSFVFGGVLTYVGFGLARAYFPSTVPLSQALC